MDEDRCAEEVDACFIACEEAYVRAREAREPTAPLTGSLLIAAATCALTLDLLAESSGPRRLSMMLRLAVEACEQCALECERDGAEWLLAARDACRASASCCDALIPRIVANGAE